jgi:hypothetical protein
MEKITITIFRGNYMENIFGNVYITEHHHQVIEAWEKTRDCDVLSLDWHTDTHPAFLKYAWCKSRKILGMDPFSSETAAIVRLQDEILENIFKNYSTDKNIQKIISLLQYDEHIDFAVSANIINNVFILCKQGGGSHINEKVMAIDAPFFSESGKRIFEYEPTCLLSCKKMPHDDECLRLLADNCISDELLSDAITKFSCFGFMEGPYILDIDCDYFNTQESMSPSSRKIFEEIIRGAKIITITKETECVEELRLEGETITSESILTSLIDMIKIALNLN